jgi:hypothetical protein
LLSIWRSSCRNRMTMLVSSSSLIFLLVHRAVRSAATLKIKQPSVSEIEKQTDMYLSTLRSTAWQRGPVTLPSHFWASHSPREL